MRDDFITVLDDEKEGVREETRLGVPCPNDCERSSWELWGCQYISKDAFRIVVLTHPVVLCLCGNKALIGEQGEGYFTII